MKGWIEKKLGDTELLKIIDGDRGKNYPSQTDFLAEGHCLFLNTKNVRPDGFNFDSTMFIDKDKDNELRKGKLERRDVILTTRGTIGNIAIYDDSVEFDNVRINSGMLIFRPNEHIITSEYLFKVLLAPIVKSQITQYTSGAAQPQLPIKTLVNFKIPVPPLSEQKRIVSIVDEAFEAIDIAIDNTKQNLTNARELFDSYLNAIFTQKGDGWKEKTLKDVCVFQGGSQPPKSVFSAQKKEGYIRLIQIRDYKSEKYVVYISKKDARRFCQPDDVMIGRYGPPLFQILRGLEGAYNVALMKAIPNEEMISKDFLFYFLKNTTILAYVINSSSRTAGQTGLNKATIEPYPIAFPTLEKQAVIVSQLQELKVETQRLEAIYQQKLTALNELKQSILHKAFTGELTADKADLKTNIEPEAICT